MNFLVGGTAPGRMGTAHPNLVPYQAFATSDGDLMLAVGQRPSVCRLHGRCVGAPELATDTRYATNSRLA